VKECGRSALREVANQFPEIMPPQKALAAT